MTNSEKIELLLRTPRTHKDFIETLKLFGDEGFYKKHLGIDANWFGVNYNGGYRFREKSVGKPCGGKRTGHLCNGIEQRVTSKYAVNQRWLRLCDDDWEWLELDIIHDYMWADEDVLYKVFGWKPEPYIEDELDE